MLTFLIIFAVAITGLVVVQAMDIECTKPRTRRGKVTRSAPAALFFDTLAGLR
jgi:hypothetical protein